MEARANYVAVGAFVLLVLAGILVGSLWLARVQFAAQYQYVETSVAGPVSGLSTAAVVRLNGIEVGRVAKIDLDPGDPNIGKPPPAGAGHDSCPFRRGCVDREPGTYRCQLR